MVGSPPLGQTGRLNIFLKQIGPVDDLGEPYFPSANLQIEFASSSTDRCDVDFTNVEITLNLSNQGDLVFPIGTPFAFYNGNPEIAATLLDTFHLDKQIEKDSFVTMQVSMDLSGETFPFYLYVVGNDDGSLAIPLSLIHI